MKAVIGNPPYNIKNHVDNILPIVYDYFTIGVDEYGRFIKNTMKSMMHMLDLYINFIRLGQEVLQEGGVMGIITNNGFLENYKFGGVRWNLLNTYDEIYILNLNGNSRINQVHNSRKSDVNIFNIQIGVCILFFIKYQDDKKKTYTNTPSCKVYYHDIQGDIKDKILELQNNDINTIPWRQITYTAPGYILNAKLMPDNPLQDTLELNEVFINFGGGIQSGLNRMVIQKSKEEMEAVLNDFKTLTKDEIIDKYQVPENSYLNIPQAIKDIKHDLGERIELRYRPFDIRYTYYIKTNSFVRNARYTTQFQVMQNNLWFCINLDCSKLQTMSFINDSYTPSNILNSYTYIAPLYIKKGGKIIDNLTDGIKQYLKNKYKVMPTPAQVIYYLYCIYNHKEFTKVCVKYFKNDYSIVKFCDDEETFYKACKLGEELKRVHLLDFTCDTIEGQGVIKYVRYKPHEGRVYINETMSFNIKPEVWGVVIGGYTMLGVYLRSRKGRVLDYNYYHKMIKAHEKTIELTDKITQLSIL